jgi:hypothetical protein
MVEEIHRLDKKRMERKLSETGRLRELLSKNLKEKITTKINK